MDTFEVRFWEGVGSETTEPSGVAAEGFQAPGRMVLVVIKGTAWVQREDGTRETIEAKSVVIYDAGDWVEYGSDATFEAELYGAVPFTAEQQTARMNRLLDRGR